MFSSCRFQFSSFPFADSNFPVFHLPFLFPFSSFQVGVFQFPFSKFNESNCFSIAPQNLSHQLKPDSVYPHQHKIVDDYHKKQATPLAEQQHQLGYGQHTRIKEEPDQFGGGGGGGGYGECKEEYGGTVERYGEEGRGAGGMVDGIMYPGVESLTRHAGVESLVRLQQSHDSLSRITSMTNSISPPKTSSPNSLSPGIANVLLSRLCL